MANFLGLNILWISVIHPGQVSGNPMDHIVSQGLKITSSTVHARMCVPERSILEYYVWKGVYSFKPNKRCLIIKCSLFLNYK